MKAVIQRVTRATVTVENELIASISNGLLVLVCVMDSDAMTDAAVLAKKIAHLRIFSDENDKMNRSVIDICGEILAVSQFTLSANTRHGNRPDFLKAAKPDVARPLFDYFVEQLRENSVAVQTGRFGADMQVELCNNGPVTILLDTEEWK